MTHRNRTRRWLPCCVFLLACLGFAAAARAQTTTTLSNANGTWTVTTNPGGTATNQIDIKFTPDANNVNCAKIVFVQTVKIHFENATVYSWGALYSVWAYRDPDALADGTIVDHIFCEKDPGYNGDDRGAGTGNQDSGQQGKSQGNGTPVTDATMSDNPGLPDAYFPGTKTMLTMEFETCAMCAVGNDPTTWASLGCIKWKLTRTKNDGTNGTATLTSTAVEARTQAHINATSTFATTHTSATTPSCPEDLPAGACVNRVYNKKGPLVFHVNANYTVESAGANVKKGSTPPDTAPPSNPVGGSLVACDYVLVPANETICIKRQGSRAQFAEIPAGPAATYAEGFEGGLETVESGVCFGFDHCGMMVNDCGNHSTFALAAPLDTSDPETLILYTVDIDDQQGSVTFYNDFLSSGPIEARDVQGGGFQVTVPPGQSTTFQYSPGQVHACLAPQSEPELRWNGKTSMNWATIADATFYHVYRGLPQSLHDLLTPNPDSCLRMTTTFPGTGNSLTEVPLTRSFFWYLVRAANSAGEGPAGNASSGPRIQNSGGACPP